jgi:hypothetical protein
MGTGSCQSLERLFSSGTAMKFFLVGRCILAARSESKLVPDLSRFGTFLTANNRNQPGPAGLHQVPAE